MKEKTSFIPPSCFKCLVLVRSDDAVSSITCASSVWSFISWMCSFPLLVIYFSSLAASASRWFSLTDTHSDSAAVSSQANKAQFGGVKLTNGGMRTQMGWWIKRWRGSQQRDDPEATGKRAGVRPESVNKNRDTTVRINLLRFGSPISWVGVGFPLAVKHL